MPRVAELDDALILRLQPVRDADLIVTFLDPTRGRVDAYARSARKGVRNFGGRLELFARGRAELNLGRGNLPQLKSFERASHLVPDTMDWPVLCLLSSVAELGAVASQPEHADPVLHAWACASLAVCVGLPHARLRLACLAIDLGFLQAIGCLPSQEHCADCGEWLSDGGTWRVASEGWMCPSCRAAGESGRGSEGTDGELGSYPSERPSNVASGQGRHPNESTAPPAVRPSDATAVDAVTLATIVALVSDPAAAHTVFLSRRVGRLLRKHVDKLLADVLQRPLRTRASLNEALDQLV